MNWDAFVASFSSMLGLGTAALVLFVFVVVLERLDSALRERREERKRSKGPLPGQMYRNGLGEWVEQVVDQVRKETGRSK